jgi:hypothetical protein
MYVIHFHCFNFYVGEDGWRAEGSAVGRELLHVSRGMEERVKRRTERRRREEGREGNHWMEQREGNER